MNKRTAKMIAYELAANILSREAHQSELSWQDDRIASDDDAFKVMDALDEISESLQARHDEMETRTK